MKRYFLIVAKYFGINSAGELNFGFVSDDANPLNNKFIKECVIKIYPQYNINNVIITNIIEFKNENDYNEFWA